MQKENNRFIPKLKVPGFCTMCNVLIKDVSSQYGFTCLCPNCDYKLQLYVSEVCGGDVKIKKPKAPKNPEGKLVLFITLTSKDQVSEEELTKRLKRIIDQDSYPVSGYYAAIEKTLRGINHMHILVAYKLKKDSRG